MTLPDARPVTLWVRLPATWVHVDATFSAPGELDALERVTLRLLARRPRTTKEVADLLGGLPEVVVENALRGLADTGLVQEKPGAVPSWSASVDDDARHDDPTPGWAAICPITECVIPEVLLDGKATAGDFERGSLELCRPDLERFAVPSNASSAALRSAVRSGITVVGRGPSTDAGERRDDRRISGMVARSELARPRVPHTRREWCWMRVDLVPSLTGTVEVVCFEPCLVPDASAERPTSRQAREWLATKAPAAWRAIEERRGQLRIENSVVLQAASIASMEDLASRRMTHRAEWGRNRPGFDSVLPRLEPRIAKALDDAHDWLVVWRQRSDFSRAAYYAYGEVVERLMQRLGECSLPALEAWSAEWNAMPPAQKKERARDLASDQHLRATLVLTEEGDVIGRVIRKSLPHMTRALEAPAKICEALGRSVGAGESLTLWLLPLLLGSASERQTFRRQLLDVDARCGVLSDYVDTLLDFRNDCMHSRDPKLTLPRADELLRDTIFALSPWLVDDQ